MPVLQLARNMVTGSIDLGLHFVLAHWPQVESVDAGLGLAQALGGLVAHGVFEQLPVGVVRQEAGVADLLGEIVG